jgi:HAD superfamily hydrolase (TIGR01549 family)
VSARWVCLDVGETLIDETRIWSTWADELGIPRLTFLAGLGAVIARGQEHSAVFDLFGVDDWQMRIAAIESMHGGFRADDLYPDALPALGALRDVGYRLAVIANQPAVRDEQLRAIGVEPEVMAMSEAIGAAKPEPAFFERCLELMGHPDPGAVAYVGDRVDNDVLPAAAAGMRAVWIRRGPWGILQPPPPPGVTALVVESLAELVQRITEAWPPADESSSPGPPFDEAPAT